MSRQDGKVAAWAAKVGAALLTAWICWASTTLVSLKSDLTVLKFLVLGPNPPRLSLLSPPRERLERSPALAVPLLPLPSLLGIKTKESFNEENKE